MIPHFLLHRQNCGAHHTCVYGVTFGVSSITHSLKRTKVRFLSPLKEVGRMPSLMREEDTFDNSM